MSNQDDIKRELVDIAKQFKIKNFMLIYEDANGLKAIGVAKEDSMTYRMQEICRLISLLCKDVAVQVLDNRDIADSDDDIGLSLDDELNKILKDGVDGVK